MEKVDGIARFSGTQNMRASLKQKSVFGALATAAGGGADFVVRLASTLILARLLVPEYFGMIGMVMAVTGIAEQFSALGLSTATIQAREITHRQCSNLFWINVGAGFGFGLAVCASAPALAWFYSDGRLVSITLALSLNCLCGGLTVQHEALLNRQMKQPQIAANRFIASLMSTCLAVMLALGGYTYWALVWREVSRLFLNVLGVWVLCPWIPGMPSRGANVGALLRFGRDMTLAQALIAMISRLDTVLIGRFAGPVTLGLYRQAYNLMMAPVEQLNGPIMGVSQPGLSMLQAEPDRYRRYYERILFVVALATIPLGVFSVIYAREIVLMALGQKWIGAVVFLQIFGVAAAIRPAVGTCGIVLITSGRSGRFFVVALVHSIGLILLSAAGVPWGAIGVAVAHVSTSVVTAPWKLWYSFGGTPVTVGGFLRVTSKPAGAALVMAVVLLFQRAMLPMDGGLMSLLVGCSTAALVYGGAFALLPGGWSQLGSLRREVLIALRHRTSGVGPSATSTTNCKP